jgi:hypothetical protein
MTRKSLIIDAIGLASLYIPFKIYRFMESRYDFIYASRDYADTLLNKLSLADCAFSSGGRVMTERLAFDRRRSAKLR